MMNEKQPQILRLFRAFSREARESAQSLRMTDRFFNKFALLDVRPC
jgi:hypothetical protein